MNKQCPIQSQITLANDTIQGLMTRVESLEKRLQSQDLDQNKKSAIENELVEIKKLLSTNKTHLSSLHKENTRSFMIAACLMFLTFLLYGIYVMTYGN